VENLGKALVHSSDVAEAAAEELLNLAFTGHKIRYVVGDETTGTKIAETLGEAINKPGLQWIVFSDEQNLEGDNQAGLNEEVAKNYTEMGRDMRTGEMNEEYNKNKPPFSNIKIEAFAKEFAKAFNA
jgi:hypothetical protein